jgi:hypothetical protein
VHSLQIIPRYSAPSAWWQHVPIAHWLIETRKPRTVVELGTHWGVSFFAFCEAAEHLSPSTFIHAVDSWKGDGHAGLYGEEVYQRVHAHWQQHHRSRAGLIRSTFDKAAEHFGPGSVDVLHIDGFHTYEAVRHDFETWRTKLADDAVVVVHDINVRTRGFGVWQWWEEMQAQYGDGCLSLLNGHGLGLIFLNATDKPSECDWKRIAPGLVGKGILLEQLAHTTEEAQRLAREVAVLRSPWWRRVLGRFRTPAQ